MGSHKTFIPESFNFHHWFWFPLLGHEMPHRWQERIVSVAVFNLAGLCFGPDTGDTGMKKSLCQEGCDTKKAPQFLKDSSNQLVDNIVWFRVLPTYVLPVKRQTGPGVKLYGPPIIPFSWNFYFKSRRKFRTRGNPPLARPAKGTYTLKDFIRQSITFWRPKAFLPNSGILKIESSQSLFRLPFHLGFDDNQCLW